MTAIVRYESFLESWITQHAISTTADDENTFPAHNHNLPETAAIPWKNEELVRVSTTTGTVLHNRHKCDNDSPLHSASMTVSKQQERQLRVAAMNAVDEVFKRVAIGGALKVCCDDNFLYLCANPTTTSTRRTTRSSVDDEEHEEEIVELVLEKEGHRSRPRRF